MAGWGRNDFGQINVPGGIFSAVAAGTTHSLALRARTEYDGDLLISGTGVSANLNRSINVAGNATVQTTTNFYNNPMATIGGKLIIKSGAPFLGAGTISTHGLDIETNNFTLPTSPAVVNSGPISGWGNLSLQSPGQHLDFALDANSLYSGSLKLGTLEAPNVSMTAVGQGFQNLGSLYLFGGEFRMGAAQRIRFAGDSINKGKIELLGSSAASSEIEIVLPARNDALTGLITGQNAVMRFDGGLLNNGAVLLSSGLNNVTGDITNMWSGSIVVSGGAAATFYDDIDQNGTFRVSKVGSTTSTAVILGAFSGSGGATGGGDIFFEGDLRPGNSPATVTFDNNVGFGAGAGLHVELGGVMPGSDYDQVHATGALSLDGALDVSLTRGFLPRAGNSFDILDWGSLSGTFATLNLPALSGGLAWNTSQLYATGVLSVVPEPATMVLLILGAAGVIGITRRVR